MTRKSPYGGSDEPYTEPADPWDGQDAAWGGNPTSAAPGSAGPDTYGSPVYGNASTGWAPPPRERRRNGPIIALVIVLALLVAGGLGGAAWLLKRKNDTPSQPQAQPSATTVATTGSVVGAEPAPSEDARFVAKGECIENTGTADAPQMRIVKCASGTFQVLKRIDGQTTGEADAEQKCAKVPNYTKWYFYDSDFDSLDFVLCLKER